MEILERVHLLETITWKGSSTGTLVTSRDYFRALTLIPNTRRKLRGFRYLAADLELSVRINSTPFHYGLLGVVWNNGIPDRYALSTPFHLIAASDPKTLTFTIPMTFGSDNYHLTDGTTNSSGRVTIVVLSTLKNVNSIESPSVEVTVYGRLTNVKTSGLLDEDIVWQGNEYVPKAKRASTNEDPEVKEKQKGIASTTAYTVGTIADSLTKVPVIGGLATVVSPVAKAFGGLFDWLGWQKPLYDKYSRPVRYEPGLNSQTRGIDNSSRIGLSQSSQISGDMGLYNNVVDNENSVLALMMLPSLIYTSAEISSNHTQGSVLGAIRVTPTFQVTVPGEIVNTPMNFLARCCTYWRGSMKYHLVISLPQTVSLRLRLTFVPDGRDPLEISNYGDMVSTVIDVSGHTEYMFCVPYMYATPYCYTERNSTAPKGIGSVVISVASPVVTTMLTETFSTRIFVFAAAGEDMELFDLVGHPTQVIPSLDVSEAQGRDYFKQTFEPLVPAKHCIRDDVNYGEKFEHLHDYTLRYYLVKKGIFTGAETVSTNNPIVTRFKYFRRSYRYRFFCNDPSVSFTFQRGHIVEIFSFKTRDFIDIEIPRISMYLFSTEIISHQFVFSNPNGAEICIFIADSDDSTYSYWESDSTPFGSLPFETEKSVDDFVNKEEDSFKTLKNRVKNTSPKT